MTLDEALNDLMDSDPVLADAAWTLTRAIEAAGGAVVGARAGDGCMPLDGCVTLTEVDLPGVSEMDDDGAVEIVIRRPTIREPPAWILGGPHG
jgi:hypothetical protein